MNNKVYKNKNMIRTNFSIKRYIKFMNNDERARFLYLYEDKIKWKNCSMDNWIFILIDRYEFEIIVKEIGLVRNKEEKSSRYYISRAALA